MRRKFLTRFLAFSLSAAMAFGNITPAYAAATTEMSESKENITDGVVNGITWAIDDEGHLTISGEGDLDYIPWQEYLDEIITAEIDVKGMTYARGLFENCRNMVSVDLTNFDTSEITVMWDMFRGCSSLTSIDLSGFDTSSVSDMDCMFENCSSLTSIDLSSFDMTNITYYSNMLYGCDSLERISTPRNCPTGIELPKPSKFYLWENLDGTVYKYLPNGMSESMTLVRTYSEEKTESPTISVEKNSDGVIEYVFVENKDDDYSWMRVGLATREQIENGNLNFSDWWVENSVSVQTDFETLINWDIDEENTYYIAAYAENDKEVESDVTVLADEPIIVKKTINDEAAVCKRGDMRERLYFDGIAADECWLAKVTVRVDSDDDSWTGTSYLETESGTYYFNSGYHDREYNNWNIESLEFVKVTATEDGQQLEKTFYTSVVEDGVFEEPKAVAPTVELRKDDNGNVVGVTITNKVTHDNANIRYGYFGEEEWIVSRWISVDAGAVVDIDFEQIEMPPIDCNEESFSFQCYAYDYELGLESQYIMLDYPITREVEEYKGESIPVYVENQTEEIKWYYVSTDAFTESLPIVYGYNSQEKINDGYSQKISFWKTNDRMYWTTDAWQFDLTSFETQKLVMNESGMKFVCTQVPKEKITFVNREFASKNILLLDYDYYQAFIASGGAITLNENAEIEVSTEGFKTEPKWTLKYLYQELSNSEFYSLVKNMANYIKSKANQYWEAGFQAINYYDMDGNVIANDSISEHEIVLVEYAPEVVWVDSMELTVPNKMERNATAMASVTLDAGQDKYPFGREPQIRYESDNPEVVAVDAETGKLTAGNVDGIARITAYADEDLKAQYGLEKILSVSAEIAVGEYSEVLLLDYDYYNAFIASGGSITINEDGNVEISTEKFVTDTVWTLDYLYKKLVDSDMGTLIKNIADDVKEWANKYWKTDVGSFKAINYYDTDGNMIAEDSISEHDIVLIEYAPEIVWVDSITLTAPEKLEKNETGFVVAELDAGQDKYPFGREPQIRYESMNPDVIEVDAKTGKLTAGSVDGNGTIIAYVDEELRAKAGLDNVTATVSVIVGEGGIANGMTDTLVWSIDKNGKLTVSGTGDLRYYENPWQEYKDQIVSAKISVDNVISMQGLFEGYQALTEVDFSGTDASELESLWNTFFGCSSLRKIDFTGFETSKIRDLDYTFYGCSSLEEIDLSGFDVSNLVYHTLMFYGCDSLEKIYTPTNCAYEIELPIQSGDTWYQEDGTVVSNLPMNSAESIVLVKNQKSEGEKPEETKKPVNEVFTDISEGSWYESAVQYVYDNGIMSGNNGLFNPTGNITRAQVVTTLYNLEGRPMVTDYSAVEEMIDVQAGQWYTDAVCWAYSVGVANGNASTKMFNMSNPVTRQQLATFFYNYAAFKGLDTETRGDYSSLAGADEVASYAADTMKWAYGTGLITGSATTVNGVTVYNLNPKGTATRAQMASILQRFCEKNHL